MDIQVRSLSHIIEDLCTRHGNDNSHTRYVTDLAAQIFRSASSIHDLPEGLLTVMEIAGHLHDLGVAEDPENHHFRSQAIIIAEGLGNLPSEVVALVGAIAACHRKSIGPKDSRLGGLSRSDRKSVLKLAAILRVADGLDYTHTQSVRLSGMAFSGKELSLYVTGDGPEAEAGVGRANEKADLWQKVMPYPIRVVLRSKDAKQLLSARDSMAAAGKAVMSFHFDRILAHEAGTRLGEDIEELHDMRVATRRLRAAFRVFSRTFAKTAVNPLLEDIRWLAAGLGEVRDLDVLLDFHKGYAREAVAEDIPGLSDLIADREAEREKRREEMLTLLDSDRYERFKGRFREFLLTPDRGLRPGSGRQRVQEEAPRAIRQRLKEVMEYDRQIQGAPPEIFHAMRIAGKRLRYTCEFFQGGYDGRLEDLIKRTVEMQDTLGGIHDADVTVGFLTHYLESLPEDIPEANCAAIRRLIEFLTTRRGEFLQSFYAAWADFTAPSTCKKVQKTITHAG